MVDPSSKSPVMPVAEEELSCCDTASVSCFSTATVSNVSDQQGKLMEARVAHVSKAAEKLALLYLDNRLFEGGKRLFDLYIKHLETSSLCLCTRKWNNLINFVGCFIVPWPRRFIVNVKWFFGHDFDGTQWEVSVDDLPLSDLAATAMRELKKIKYKKDIELFKELMKIKMATLTDEGLSGQEPATRNRVYYVALLLVLLYNLLEPGMQKALLGHLEDLEDYDTQKWNRLKSFLDTFIVSRPVLIGRVKRLFRRGLPLPDNATGTELTPRERKRLISDQAKTAKTELKAILLVEDRKFLFTAVTRIVLHHIDLTTNNAENGIEVNLVEVVNKWGEIVTSTRIVIEDELGLTTSTSSLTDEVQV